MNLAEGLKQPLRKPQLTALQQISEFPETVEEVIGQRGELVSTQVQLQQVPLEGIMIKLFDMGVSENSVPLNPMVC